MPQQNGRIVAHLDMDAFYATAELIRNPALKGLPVAVGGRRGIEPLPGQPFPTLAQYQGRGVLTTANYEARALGLKSAMPTMKAAKLAPHAVLLPADFEWYKTQSRRFKSAVLELAPVMEDRGIDEIYLDLTEQCEGSFEQAIALAGQLKAAVRQATGGMTCSIGLAANKLTAKICSDLQKPDGLSVVKPEAFLERLGPLPVGRINGVGPKAQARLAEMGVQTIAQLNACPLELLQARFGANLGAWMHRSAHGEDERPVVQESEPKSISRETTFETDLHVRRDRDALTATLLRLAERLSADLARKGCVARTIGVKVRYADFRSVTRDITTGQLHREAPSIVEAARQCLKKTPFDVQGPRSNLRLLGIKASHLLPEQAALAADTASEPVPQLSLAFDPED